MLKNNNLVNNHPYWDTSLGLETRVYDLVSRLTIDEKISLLPTRQAAVARLGIKEYSVGGEAAHGLVSPTNITTVFPQPIGLACSWNASLLEEIGSAIGDEARAYYKKNGEKGGLTLWAPTIDMERDPRWGRTEEAYGEDPYLTGKLSSGLIRGMQGYDDFYLKMAAAPKHFYANNNEEGRIWCSSSIDPRNKQEYYLKAFKPAFVEGGAYSMMTAYNSINGTPGILNPEVQNIVKDEWGLRGFVVCDGGDMSQTVEFHKYYETHAETMATAIKSGVDCFTDDVTLVIKSTKEAFDRGLILESEIDKAIFNIFKVRFRLGQFDPEELNPYSKISSSVICSEKHNELAKKAAREAIVLLKNENKILPLNKDSLSKVAVIGPLSDVVYKDWYCGVHPYKVTPLQGIKSKLPTSEVIHVNGYDQITLKSISSNKYLSVETSRDFLVFADKDVVTANETFELSDWGWGSSTLKSIGNDKFLTTNDDGVITASSAEAFGWFVKELYNLELEDISRFSYSLKTWDGKNITLSSNILSVNINPSKVEEDESIYIESFRKTIVIDGIKEAVEAAKTAEVAIVVVGNNPMINGKEENDREDITLPKAQQDLIKAVYKTNPNTIVVIVGSYPYAINRENDNIPAIIYSAPGGQELGNAIADVLFGDYSPSGKLNMTWYKSLDQLSDMLDYDIIKSKRTYMYFDQTPLYPFGYGLTYSTFGYRDLNVQKSDGHIDVSVQVENTGSTDSDEVVQMYISSKLSRVKRPFKELKGFSRIHLLSKEFKTINFSLCDSDFSFWDVTRSTFCVETGDYEISIGNSSQNIKLSQTIKIEGEIIPPRDLTKVTRAENYDDYNGIILDECLEGGTSVHTKKSNSFIMFDDVNFGNSDLRNGVSSFEARVSNVLENADIEVRLDKLDGPIVGTCNVPAGLDMKTYITTSCNISPIAGIHKVFLILNGQLNMSWLRFINK